MGYAMAEVFRQKPSAIEELNEIVEELARELSEVICGVMANFGRRCQACLKASSGAFKHFLDFTVNVIC